MAGFDGIRPIQPPVEPLRHAQARDRVQRRTHGHNQQPDQERNEQDDAPEDEQPTAAYDDHGRRTRSSQANPEDPLHPPRHINFRA